MALFFDLSKLEQLAGTDAIKFIDYLWFHWKKPMLTRFNKHKKPRLPLAGYSYLLNPEAFFNDRSTDILFKVQYIKLAGRRDYSMYKMYGYDKLQTSFFPDLAVKNIKFNPLLEITPTEISFKLEKI